MNHAAAGVSPPIIKRTYKAHDAESWTDIHFNRPLGLLLAIFFRKLGWTPIMVTLLGGVFGIVGGHLYYYRDLKLNLIGVGLHIIANLLDNADGQLARLTGASSRKGRLIDSVVDQAIFINIYFNLGFRCLATSSFWPVALLAFPAGLSHAFQAAAADYYRNAYLYFTTNRTRGEFDSSTGLRLEFHRLSWGENFWRKLLHVFYLNLTRQQEMISPGLFRLQRTVARVFADGIPQWFQARYRELAKPAFKWWGWLMTNPRVFLLFVLLLMNRPLAFFWFGLTGFNLLLVYLLWREKKMAESLLEFLGNRHGGVR
jgi:CDP-alcohol phosphatidyltransferase